MRPSGSLVSANDLDLTDGLTGLGNERRFYDKVERLIEERADDPAPFAVAIVDLDGFKPINDLFGRCAGDEILVQAAQRLRAAMDQHSYVARIGGDEFAVLLPMVFSEQGALETVRLLMEILSAPYHVGERTARLSATCGCAVYLFDEGGAGGLIGRVESALYQAKRAGRGRVLAYTQEMEAAARRLTMVEQALRRAVASGDVEPHFQPIVDISSGAILGFEALARWTDRDLGAISPSLFIPLAEERGFIGPLSQLLLDRAVAAAAHWPEDIFLSFNLSPSQLVDQNTALNVLHALDRVGFDPRRLEIEITETGIMSDPVSARKIVGEFRSAGMRVSLDDFGTGQSSLGRLREFPFDKLKIDRSFVSPIVEDRAAEHIVRAILTLCEGLDMEVVAEGVETDEQAARLMQLGCACGQGYLFSPPVDAARAMGWVRRAALSSLRAGRDGELTVPPRRAVHY